MRVKVGSRIKDSRTGSRAAAVTHVSLRQIKHYVMDGLERASSALVRRILWIAEHDCS